MKPLFHLSKTELESKKILDWGYTEDLMASSYDKFEKWIEQSEYFPLHYLADHRKEKRKDVREYYKEAQSVLVFLFDYRSFAKNNQKNIASYVVGFDDEDYHLWIGRALKSIGNSLKKLNLELDYKLSLDIHPVLERDMAYRAGLGWFGKNSMHINRVYGSFYLIGSIVLNQKLALESAHLDTDHCGNCSACVDACPTQAINPNGRTILAQKCISTFTIEQFKDEHPPQGYPTKSQEVFGCDICQDVCPWNKKALKSVESETNLRWNDFFKRDYQMIYQEIDSMSNKDYKKFFVGTSFERLGKKGLLKNLKYYL